MHLGLFPKDVATTKEVIDQMYQEIAYLKGKLKMLPNHRVQTMELLNEVTEKEHAQTKWWERQY